ncbi:MAG TPA: hypothetical protein VLD65_09905, partial [Anaerolineales bacterium]|nr:hypothetical protein [Anaerolineales bacterium]
MNKSRLQDILGLLDGSLVMSNHQIDIVNAVRLQENIHRLAEIAALGKDPDKGMAQYIIRQAALAYGAIPASMIGLYLARGKGEIPLTFTVPAMNLRMLAFESARAVFRVAKEMNAGAFVFEIARSEMGY